MLHSLSMPVNGAAVDDSDPPVSSLMFPAWKSFSAQPPSAWFWQNTVWLAAIWVPPSQ